MRRKRGIFIVPIAQKDAANAWVKANLAYRGGENTFRVGYSTDGTPPWTHYLCNWMMTEDEYTKLSQRISVYSGGFDEVQRSGRRHDHEASKGRLGIKTVETDGGRDDLTTIAGIDGRIQADLNAVGIFSKAELKAAHPNRTASATGKTVAEVNGWKGQINLAVEMK